MPLLNDGIKLEDFLSSTGCFAGDCDCDCDCDADAFGFFLCLFGGGFFAGFSGSNLGDGLLLLLISGPIWTNIVKLINAYQTR